MTEDELVFTVLFATQYSGSAGAQNNQRLLLIHEPLFSLDQPESLAITGLEGLQRTLQIAAAQVDKSKFVVGRGTIHHLVKTLHLEGRALDPTYLNNIYTTYCDYE